METMDLLGTLMRFMFVWWYTTNKATSGSNAKQGGQTCSSTSGSSCMPSLKRKDRKRSSTSMHTSLPCTRKHSNVSSTGMASLSPAKYSFLRSLLTPSPLSAAVKSDSACRYTPKSKTDSNAYGAGVFGPSTPSPVDAGCSSTVSRSSSSSNKEQQAVRRPLPRLPSLFGPSTPGFMLPTASSKARSLGMPNKSSTYQVSTASTAAQVDRVRKVTPSAKHQDNSSSKAEQQDTNTKLRTARDRLQAQLRQLQELHLTEAKASKAQLAAVKAERAQLREQISKQTDELCRLRLKVAEQDTQLAAAHISQQAQLRKLGAKYGAEAQVLSTQLSAAADEVARLQAKLATQAEELRMLRANTQDNSGPLQAQLKELEGRLQAQAKGYEGQLAASAAELEACTEELRVQGRKLNTVCRERDSNLSAFLQKEEQQEHEAAAFQHTYDDLSSELAAVQEERDDLKAALRQAHSDYNNLDLWSHQRKIEAKHKIHYLELFRSGNVELDFDAVKSCSCWQGDSRCTACAHHQSLVDELDAIEAQLADMDCSSYEFDAHCDSPRYSCSSSGDSDSGDDSSSEDDSSSAGEELGSRASCPSCAHAAAAPAGVPGPLCVCLVHA